ncbi:MAG TPA: 1-(5-phosphoribosyl)-5-((5-phosphoribosylamino)methylideneamino)imidazole-4-carboxamide isomerase [Acidimicrobiia bacterium]|nr:1-(5-phosphoribosyl)-5-((5-phosphoribosylamino)methylideneamino)imidazole-4-carboxamide isomerase [Acidimicrobiia bacterium]
MDFIFMLTNHDATVPDAIDVYESIRKCGLRMVGFKDIGASPDTLRRLTEMMHEDARTVFLEVVSTSADDELRSIEAGLALGVDVIMGGTNHDAALALIGSAPVRYFPFPGTVVGHPSELRGSIDEIAAHAAELTSRPAVGGLDLLAYRHRTEDPIELTRAVVAASRAPVVVAGSIDRAERIRGVAGAGAWAFTIGGAIFDGVLPGAPDMAAEIEWTLQQCG